MEDPTAIERILTKQYGSLVLWLSLNNGRPYPEVVGVALASAEGGRHRRAGRWEVKHIAGVYYLQGLTDRKRKGSAGKISKKKRERRRK